MTAADCTAPKTLPVRLWYTDDLIGRRQAWMDFKVQPAAKVLAAPISIVGWSPVVSNWRLHYEVAYFVVNVLRNHSAAQCIFLLVRRLSLVLYISARSFRYALHERI